MKLPWKMGETEPELEVGQGEIGHSWGDSPRVCRAVCYPTLRGFPPWPFPLRFHGKASQTLSWASHQVTEQ